MTTHPPHIRRPHELQGAFSVVKSGRGRTRRRTLVFTSHDGFTGESHRWSHREAYEAAVAARAAASFRQQRQTASSCPKAAPEARLLHALDDSALFGEVERRGWAVALPEDLGIDTLGNPLAPVNSALR